MTTTPTTPSSQMSIENEHSGIVSLLPTLRAIARRHHWRNPQLVSDADDLLHDSIVSILTERPNYPHGLGLLVRIAHLRMSDRAGAERTYDRYVSLMPTFTDDDGEEVDYAEFIPSDELGPEAALIERQTQAELQADLANALQTLTPVQRRIVGWLINGVPKSEIAARLNVSRPRISKHLEHLRANPQLQRLFACVS